MTAESKTDTPFTLYGWQFQPQLLRVTRDDSDQHIAVEPKVMKLLGCLAGSANRPVTRAEIMKQVWGHEYVTEDALNRLVSRLRRFLSAELDCEAVIETIPRVGYRLVQDDGDARPATTASSRPWWRYAAAALLLAAAVAVIYLNRPDPPAVNGYAVQAVPLTTMPGREIQPTLSVDGNQFAFARQPVPGENWDLYVRSVHNEAMLRITSDEGNSKKPVWSPDGQWLAYLYYIGGGCEVRLVSPLGGDSRRFADCDPQLGDTLAWAPDGSGLVFHPPGEPGLVKTLLSDGSQRRLTEPPDGTHDSGPAFSPDASTLAFVRWPAAGVSDVWLAPGEGGNARRLTHDYLKLHGVTWNPDSRSILFASNRSGGFALWQLGLEGGEPLRVPVTGRSIDAPLMSADGRRLIYQEWYGQTNVFSINEVGDQPARVTHSTRWDWSAEPSPDGRRLAFVSDRSGATEIWIKDIGNPDSAMRLTDFGGPFLSSPVWSPDGGMLVFDATVENGNFDLYSIDPDGGAVTRLTTDPAADRYPRFSHDGSQLLFASRRSGDWQVWRRPLEGGAAEQITQDGGYRAQQSGDGSLYFSKIDQPGLWRLPPAGNGPVRVIDELQPLDTTHWTLSDDAVYYVQRDDDYRAYLMRYDPDQGQRARIAQLPRLLYKSGLGAGPDGAFYFASVVHSETDLSMAEWAE